MKIDDVILRDGIRLRLMAGLLPGEDGCPVSSGDRMGDTCSACDEVIDKHDVITEWARPDDAAIALHQACYQILRTERQRPGAPVGAAQEVLFYRSGFLCASCLSSKASGAVRYPSTPAVAPAVFFDIRVGVCRNCDTRGAVIAVHFRQARDADGMLLCLECERPIGEGMGVAIVHLTSVAKVHTTCLTTFRRHRFKL